MAQATVRAAESFSPKSSTAGVVFCYRLLCMLPMSSVFAGSGSDPPDATMSGLLHVVLSMRQEQLSFQSSVNIRLHQIERSVSSRPARDVIPHQAGEAPSQEVFKSRSSSRARDDTSDGLVWNCPICGTGCSHRASFKGHIRLCVNMQHQRCVLMEDNPKHQDLLSKFPNGAWQDRSQAFTNELYDQVVVCSTSLDPPIKSHEHIFGWVAAAVSKDPSVMLPTYFSGRPESKRRRSRGVDRNAAGVCGRSSNDSSPELPRKGVHE